MQIRESKPTVRFIILMSAILFFGICWILLGLLILKNEADTKLMLTDTLNQQMEIRQEMDALKQEVTAQHLVFYPDTNGLTEDERDLVQRVVEAEARGEGIEGMMAVAQVIRDRSYTWDQSITEVCLAKGQFAKPYQDELGIESWIAVSKVFDGGQSVLEVPTTHFYADYIEPPSWIEGKANRGKIGRHEFWY